MAIDTGVCDHQHLTSCARHRVDSAGQRTQGTDAQTRASKPRGYETWEDGVSSDCAKVHAVRPDMPTFGYYGFYVRGSATRQPSVLDIHACASRLTAPVSAAQGCCDAGADNGWFPQFNASNASALWLRDDNGKVARFGSTPLYDFCEPRMMEFYKETILADYMASPDIHGSFFDEVQSRLVVYSCST